MNRKMLPLLCPKIAVRSGQPEVAPAGDNLPLNVQEPTRLGQDRGLVLLGLSNQFQKAERNGPNLIRIGLIVREATPATPDFAAGSSASPWVR
jgi:hypothetical protein